MNTHLALPPNRHAEAADDGELFQRLRSGPDAEARSELIRRHLPLARRLARRYARSADMDEELEQVASIGLIKAVDRYDPDRGPSFRGFAIPTIVGELRRHFRDTRWALHVPRNVQERAQQVAHEAEELRARLHRSPTTREIARALGLTLEEVLEARGAFAALDASSLDAPLEEGDDASDEVGDLVGALDQSLELVEARVTVAPLIAALPDRERVALQLRFRMDMTQAEIGEQLGISQMHVSRLLRRSLRTLREAAVGRAA